MTTRAHPELARPEARLTVASIEAWRVVVPFARPIRFSTSSWDGWNYVVVRVRTDEGREAAAYSFIGEIPIDVMVTELVAPRLVGVDAGDLRDVVERCANAAGPPLADVVRPAASLVEVCLWDLAAQAAEVPLWRLLCGEPARREAPVMHVEHRREGDTTAAFAERVAAIAASGVPAVKVKHYGDVAETTGRLAAVRAAAPADLRLILDVGWAWPDVATAVREARAWEPFGLTWLEDPFPPNRIADAAQLRAAIDIPLGIGDMVTSLDVAERLIGSGAVDVLRVDVTTMGGIGGVARLAGLAVDAGVSISPELLVESQQHLAFAWPSVVGVEVYSPASGIWGAGTFVLPDGLTFDGPGRIVLPERPGSGLAVDWEAVDRLAARHSRVGPS